MWISGFRTNTKKDIQMDIFSCKRETGIEFGIAHKPYNNQGGKHSIRELSPEVSPKFNFIFLN